MKKKLEKNDSWLTPPHVSECSVLTYHYGDGSYFKGTVDTHGRPSQGEFYNEDGILTYNGSFVGGQYDGYGVMYGEDGAQYQGSFRRWGQWWCHKRDMWQ